ncbi:MAG: TonB-dependent receptor [Verrucomicrobia bacterium]|nr:TonB-dependent receptor [Verrucomicrobiota bacterium]
MTPPNSLLRAWLIGAALVFANPVAPPPLAAQPAGAGTIQGRVFNPATREYVNNAEVRLDGSNTVTYSEQDGSFQLIGVPPGTVTITITYAGYTPAKETFQLTAGQTAVREINLTSTAATSVGKDGVVKLEAFTVSSAREGNSKAVQAQRRDMNIITSVSSDIFGEVMDGNVGEFLKYLPGVDLEYVESEPRGPRLGGMDTQYVGVAMDGMRTASADANRGGGAQSRATSFEGFSITSVDSIEINRTASPENDADSPAGTINMRTKRAFDRKGRVFNYNYSLNLNGEEFTLKKTPGIQDGRENVLAHKWLPNWQLGYAESFLQQRFGVLLSASHGASYTEQTSETVDYSRAPTATDPRPLVVRSVSFGDGPKFIVKDALLLTADWKATPRLTLSLNLSYSYFEGHFWNRSFGFTAANNNANINNGRGTVGGDGILTVIGTRAPTGNVNNVAALGNGGGSSAKLTYTRQYAPRFEYKHGAWTVDGAIAYSMSHNNYESLERGFTNSEGGSVPSSFVATRANPQSWEWDIRQTSGGDWFDLRNFTDTNSSTGGTRVNNDNRTWITEKYTATLNARWVVPFLKRFPTVMKFGGKWDEESRNNRTDSPMDVWSYVGPGGNTVQGNPNTFAMFNTAFGSWANVGPQFVSPFAFDMGTTNAINGGGVRNISGAFGMIPRVSRTEIARLFREHPEQFVNTSTPENFYTSQYANARRFRQTINSGYWQADTRFTPKLTVRFGVRVEQTGNALKERDPLTRPQLLARGVPLNAPATNGGRPLTIAGMRTMFETNPFIIRRSTYTDWFPSLVAKYQILPNLEWQIGANRGISRPGVDNLTGLWVINDNANPPTVSAPNPTLQPERHKVYQTRLAYYFGGRSPGQVSLALIQDEATNFIQSRTYTADDFGVDDPDFAGYNFVSTINNATLQRYKNLDINYNQTLGFLRSEYLRGISVGGTYTRSYANQRRNNLAPHRWTGRLGYAYRRFNGSLGFIWVDDRPIDGVYGRVWGAMTKFDLSLSLKVNQYATLFVQARNPTNQKDLRYESPPGVEEGKSKHLRHMEEYGDNWIFGVRGTF